jgi:hypothetical protein
MELMKYARPCKDMDQYCYKLNVYFTFDEDIADTTGYEELIKSQVAGANYVWGRFNKGVIVVVIPGNPPGDAYSIELTNSEQVRVSDGGGSQCGRKIRLHVGSARSNQYLLAHELGHLWGLRHKPTGNTVMVPRSPNQPKILKEELDILRDFLKAKTETDIPHDPYIDLPKNRDNTDDPCPPYSEPPGWTASGIAA